MCHKYTLRVEITLVCFEIKVVSGVITVVSVLIPNHIRAYQNHNACGNYTLRALITLVRVVITLVSVIFTRIRVKITLV
jgi:ABC-type sulfate transport system permease subunit